MLYPRTWINATRVSRQTAGQERSQQLVPAFTLTLAAAVSNRGPSLEGTTATSSPESPACRKMSWDFSRGISFHLLSGSPYCIWVEPGREGGEWGEGRKETGRQKGPLLIATGEALPLRGLEGVPGLPGAPQDEAGLTRKFETSHVGGATGRAPPIPRSALEI